MDVETMRTTGQELRRERDEARVTQQEIADALEVPRYAIEAVESQKTGETVDPVFAQRYRSALDTISPRRPQALKPERAS
jgi:cytoskeletal protein RodZ